MGGFVPDVHDLSTTGPRAWVSAGWWIARAGWRTSQSPWTPPCPVSTRVIEARVVAIDLGGLGSRCGYPPIRYSEPLVIFLSRNVGRTAASVSAPAGQGDS